MKRISMKLHYKQVLDRVTFQDADHLDRTRIAEEITRLSREMDPAARTVHRTQVANWIIYGKVPEKYMPLLRKIDFDKVSTNRKPFKREKIVLTHPDIAQPELNFDPD